MPAPPRTAAVLIATQQRKFLFFWGHQPEHDGSIGAGFDQQTWEAERFDIVVAGNLGKFGQNPGLKTCLTGTRNRVLVEASPLDRIWGIGLTRDDPAAADPARRQGLNLLGFALMQVRATLLDTPPDQER